MAPLTPRVQDSREETGEGKGGGGGGGGGGVCKRKTIRRKHCIFFSEEQKKFCPVNFLGSREDTAAVSQYVCLKCAALTKEEMEEKYPETNFLHGIAQNRRWV